MDSPSSSSGSEYQLDPSTLSILDSFLQNRAEEQQRFNELEEVATQKASLGQEAEDHEPMMSVDEYRLAFGENWQLSQFWYSTAFANHLAECLHRICSPTTNIAFLCCPTAFVAFQHMKPLPGARLLEVDQRFGVLSPKHYVHYDIDSPDSFPEELKHSFDIAIADPPFLNERTNLKVAQTLRQILKPDGKLILLTSTSVEEVIEKVYTEQPLGPLQRTSLSVKHGQLANDFASWGSWPDATQFGS